MGRVTIFPPLEADERTVRLRFERNRINITVVGRATGTRYRLTKGDEFDCREADATILLAAHRGGSQDFVKVVAKPKAPPPPPPEPKAEPPAAAQSESKSKTETHADAKTKSTGTAAKKAAEAEKGSSK